MEGTMFIRCFLLSLFVVTLSAAQISITHSDYQQAMAVNEAFSSYMTPSGSSINVFVGAGSSSPQYWDFSVHTTEYLGTVVSVDPATAPFHSTFPASNIVLYAEIWGTDTIRSWSYHELQSDRVLIHGESDENAVGIAYDPPVIQSMIPLSFGTTWKKEYDSTYVMPDLWFVNTKIVTVDAFGTMKLEDGEHACLRMTQDDLTISHTPVGSDTLFTRSYHWFAKDMTEIHILGITEAEKNETTPEVNGFTWSKPGAPVGVEETPLLPVRFALEQNYPNPFNPETIIRYSLPVNGYVAVSVYDILGREVATLVDGFGTAGTHEVRWDASEVPGGVYVCRLTAGGVSMTRKLLVMK
jgi:hypothetical protein